MSFLASTIPFAASTILTSLRPGRVWRHSWVKFWYVSWTKPSSNGSSKRAERHHRSLEAELREILEQVSRQADVATIAGPCESNSP